MSPTEAVPRFERWVGQDSNLDRCTRCGRPRSVHGDDWSCPSLLPHRTGTAALITGGAGAVLGIVLRLTSAFADRQIAASVFLAGVVLLIAGLSMLGRDA